jgi:hypothetical protein
MVSILYALKKEKKKYNNGKTKEIAKYKERKYHKKLTCIV